MRLIVNQSRRPGEGRQVYQQLCAVLDRFVQLPDGSNIDLQFLGEIPSDPIVREAVQRRQLLLQNYPGCPAGIAINTIGGRVAEIIAA